MSFKKPHIQEHADAHERTYERITNADTNMQKRMHIHANTHTDTRTNALPTLRSDEPTAKRELMANQDMNSLQENAYNNAYKTHTTKRMYVK